MTKNEFRRALAGMSRVWRLGLALCAVMRASGYLLVMLLCLGIMDYFLAFDTPVCVVLDAAVLLVSGFLLLKWLGGVLSLREEDAACRADDLLQSRRRSILSALELDKWLATERGRMNPLQVYLMEQSVEQAAKDLGRLGFSDHFPFKAVWSQLKVLVVQLTVAAGVAALNPDASLVIASRFAGPFRDIPPYSRFVFDVTPERPVVVYGGNTEVAVKISGAPVRAPVMFVTRSGGKIHQTVCFQESGGRYAQRMEKLVGQIEFCFATGRARSRWRTVELLMQPEIASVNATITPPAYTGRPARNFQAGREEFAAYKHSKVELRVRSNRPLADGVLTIMNRRGVGGNAVIQGRKTGLDGVSFAWTMDNDARIEVVIRDARGTRNREPLVIEQKIIADKAPEIAITEPGGFSLATPRAVISVAGQASDDLGLRRVVLSRAVAGYRDRSMNVGPVQNDARLDFSRKVDLKSIGAGVGQVLEFYAEASDTNPDLTGVAASEVARVQIISEQEYAEMIRARTTLDDFAERYRTVRGLLDNYSGALEDLAAAKDASKTAEQVRKAADTARKTAEELSKIAMDFPAFDMEDGLRAPLLDFAEMMRRQADRMDRMKPPFDGLRATMAELLAELKRKGEPVEEQLNAAGEVEAVGRVMEMAARFKALTARESDVVRRLDRFSKEGHEKDERLLESLGAREGELKSDVLKFTEDLRKNAAALPGKYKKLADSAEGFAGLVRDRNVAGLKEEAATAAGNGNGRKAHESARLALERMKEIMEQEKNGAFGEMCGGNCGQCSGSAGSESLKETLRQMLKAMLARSGGQGQTGTSGGPGGGDMNDGYGTGGYSPMNVPVYGPPRTSYRQPAAGGGSGNGPGGGAGRGGPGIRPAASERLEPQGAGRVDGDSQPMENLPEKYRDAIKKYFSTPEDKHE